MKCAICSATFNDGVQCGSCKKHFDFGCAQITEVGWRKLGPERRTAWKCPTCKSGSPNPSPASSAENVSLDLVLKEVRELKLSLASFPKLMEDIKTIKQEWTEVKASCEFALGKLDDFGTRMSELESRVSALMSLNETAQSLQNQINIIRAEQIVSDQRTRLNNVEIKGIPVKKDENLFKIVESISGKVNHALPKCQINYIYRVPVYNSKEKSIIVSFINRYMKEEFVAAARATKLTAADIGFGDTQRIYVNDHLNADSKNLLNKVKILAKEKGFSFVWIKYGKIHVRKTVTSRVFTVNKESDLNRFT